MKTKVIFTCGIQASGKSSWAKKFVAENKEYKRICRDDLRHMLYSYSEFSKENENLVTKIERELMNTLIDQKYHLVIDKMNLNKSDFESDKRYLNSICSEGVEFEVKEFPVELQVAIDRDAKRDYVIGKEIIKRTWRKYEVELKQMIERSKYRYPVDPNLPWCIICDIDGTLADSTNRQIFDETKVSTDKVIKPVASILEAIACKALATGELCKNFIFSGRTDSSREQTEKWLQVNLIPYNALYMRKTGDNRDDREIKRELFDQYIKGKFNVLLVIDDRKKVCAQWVEMGLFLLDVSQDPLALNQF